MLIPNEKSAGDILSGTKIANCFIRSNDSSARVEISGNDVVLYDDSYLRNGVIEGDTSSIKFLRSDDNSKGFIFEKRVGKDNDSDNILELYAQEPAENRFNSLFIGRRGNEFTGNLSSFTIAINCDSTKGFPLENGGQNGFFTISVSRDGVASSVAALAIGDAGTLYKDWTKNGQVALLVGSDDDGLSGLGYENPGVGVGILLYVKSLSEISLGANLIPDTDNAFNLGSSDYRLKDVNVGGRLNVGKVTDAGPMTNTNGVVGDIVFNTSNSKFYGCTSSGTPATWAALN